MRPERDGKGRQMGTQSVVLVLVTALALALFGALYSMVVVYVLRRMETLTPLALFVMSPVGIAVPVLAAAVVVELSAVLWVFAALAVAAVPVLVIVGPTVFRQLHDRRIEL